MSRIIVGIVLVARLAAGLLVLLDEERGEPGAASPSGTAREGASGGARLDQPAEAQPRGERSVAAPEAGEAGGSSTSITGADPTAPDERVLLNLTLEAEHPILLGRILHETGEPCAEQSLQYFLWHRSEAQSSGESRGIRTDEDGRFEVVLVEDPDPDWDVREVELHHRDGAIGRRTEVTVDISDPLVSGPNDLGDLILTLPPLLASGVVFDGDGQPLEGAQVVTDVPLDSGLEAGSAPAEGLELSGNRTGARISRWRPLSMLEVLSASNGAFEVRGYSEATRLRLSAGKQGFCCESAVEVGPGATNVRLVLQSGGRIVGSLLLDDRLPEVAVRATLTAPGAASPSLAGIEGNGAFAWSDLPAGIYEVGILPVADPEPMIRIEGVRVEAGQTSEDERLQGIDLRGRLAFARLEVVDERGGVIEEARVLLPGSGASPTRSFIAWHGGIELATARPPLDVRVVAPGFLSQDLADVRGDRQVVLERGIPVRLVLAAPPVLPPDISLHAHLSPRWGGENPGTVDCRFDGTGEARAAVSEDGTYRVVFRVRRHHGRGFGSRNLQGPWPHVEVVEGGEQTFRFEIDPERIEEALKAP